MPLGEKLWEEKGATKGLTIKSISDEGTEVEANFVGELKGLGRMKGIDGRYMATANVLQGPQVTAGVFQGILTTNKGETVIMKGYGTGKNVGGRFRGANIARLSTNSKRLSWMNSLIVFWEVEAAPNLEEFTGIAYEWK